jgi:exodeoxyribonuclease VII large subunit
MSATPPYGASQTPPASVIPVSLLNRLAREKLESAFPLCWIAGEISNLTYASSGHVYFSLKDAAAQVRCVMFRNRAQLLGWRLDNGQHVEVRALVTLYEARGDFQLNVEAARKAGVGSLYEEFLRLKEKLEREGLFALESKRPLPPLPHRIGIVTSPQAAALRDILTTLLRRAPYASIVIYPTPVQGAGAGAQIAQTIRTASERGECDLLIVCRGGGSLEDLWAFNDEAVARAIRASAMPVISGVGHETDFTIADFAADQRAATPTAAAELAAPEQFALRVRINELGRALRRKSAADFDQRRQQLDWLAQRLLHPAERLAQRREQLAHLERRLSGVLKERSTRSRERLFDLKHRLALVRPDAERLARPVAALAPRLHGAWQRNFDERQTRLAQFAASLAHLNVDAVLARGYSIVADATGRIVRDGRTLEPNDKITVSFHTGRAQATIDSVSD